MTKVTGRFVRFDSRLVDIVGFAPDELRALSLEQLTHPDDLHADPFQLDRLRRGEIAEYQLEERYVHKCGDAVGVGLNVSLLRDDAGRPGLYVKMVEPIGARKAAEEALRVSEARYELATRATSDAI